MPPATFKYLQKGDWFIFVNLPDNSDPNNPVLYVKTDDDRAMSMRDGHVWDVSPGACTARLLH
jgi:hypothetical protein